MNKSVLKKERETSGEQDFLLVDTLLKSSSVITKVSEVLTILTSKRATLEEEMIGSYLIKLAAVQGQILLVVLSNLENLGSRINDDKLEQIIHLAEKLLDSLENFLRAAKHSLNYLEQYFEHRFCHELKNSNFFEDSSRYLMSISRNE